LGDQYLPLVPDHECIDLRCWHGHSHGSHACCLRCDGICLLADLHDCFGKHCQCTPSKTSIEINSKRHAGIRVRAQTIKHKNRYTSCKLLVYLFLYLPSNFQTFNFATDYNFSNSLTNLSSTSKPPCQNFAERISIPASLKIFAGASEPPADSILRYLGLNASPSALNC
jgi:hypothetical protein